MLILLVLLPAVIVPALLLGHAEVEQLCLKTLEQRRAKFLQMGSFPLEDIVWEPVPGWPGDSGNYPLPVDLVTLPPQGPSQTAAAFYGGPVEHRWVTVKRSLPFAWVMPIMNSQALRRERRDIVDAKRVAFAVFDPADAGDRAAMQALDEELLQGFDEVEKLRGRERSRREATRGEAAARDILSDMVWRLDRMDPVPAARDVLLHPRRHDLDTPSTTTP